MSYSLEASRIADPWIVGLQQLAVDFGQVVQNSLYSMKRNITRGAGGFGNDMQCVDA